MVLDFLEYSVDNITSDVGSHAAHSLDFCSGPIRPVTSDCGFWLELFGYDSPLFTVAAPRQLHPISTSTTLVQRY